MNSVLLGIDIGTSACKAAAFDSEGKVLAQATKGYNVYYPEPGFVEQNPMEWWNAVTVAIREIIETGKVKPEKIAGIGVDGQSWSAIPVDSSGYVLHNTPIWMDTRSKDICEELTRKIGFERILALAATLLNLHIPHQKYSGSKKISQKYTTRLINFFKVIVSSHTNLLEL